jgi:hypothetical protein
VKPTPPEVRCKQEGAQIVPGAPRAGEWVAWIPPSTGSPVGVALLSERAATWIAEILGLLKTERDLRQIEHKCLDEHEAKGLIRQ